MSWFIGEIAAALIPALKDDDWSSDGFRLRHDKSGMRLWTANGPWLLKLEDKLGETAATFTTIEKHVLWRYVRKLEKMRRKHDREKIVAKIISARLGQGETE